LRGRVAEWFKAAVLKTAGWKRSVSSNLTPSSLGDYLRFLALLGAILCVMMAIVALPGCGMIDGKITKPTKILIFSAPWCEPCKQEVPEAEKIVGKLGFLYVETGWRPTEPPTVASSTAYVKSLGVSLPFSIDPWRWQVYQRYFKSFTLPAAVALDDKGHILVRFGPGKITEDLKLAMKKWAQ
jgi:thiol-disulfide isomerase/thioredoxin